MALSYPLEFRSQEIWRSRGRYDRRDEAEADSVVPMVVTKKRMKAGTMGL